jgi:uncharacterized protein YyaL (SSP411 family)
LQQKDIVVRKKEVYDGALPSGNAMMALNLWQLSLLFDNSDWKKRSRDMVASLGKAITTYPNSFANWASLMQEMIEGTHEIAIIGADYSTIHKEILLEYIPHRILMASPNGENDFPILAGKQPLKQSCVFLCRSYTCLHPVFSLKELMLLINRPSSQ